MNFKQLIHSYFDESLEYFSSDKFAYLSFTGKIESNLRDELAYYLNQKVSTHSNLFATREWKRYDIGIINLKTKNPEALIEIKSQFSIQNIKDAAKEMINDISKAKKDNIGNPEIFFILIGTVFSKSDDVRFNELTKNRIIKYNIDHLDNDMNEIESKWKEEFFKSYNANFNKEYPSDFFGTKYYAPVLLPGTMNGRTVSHYVAIHGPFLKSDFI